MTILTTILYGPALLVQAMPLACFGIGGFFIAMQLGLWRLAGKRMGRRMEWQFFRMAPVFSGLLWIIFAMYELQMQAVTKVAALTIRLDLLVLTPILYVFTLVALVSLVQQFRGRAGDFRGTETDKRE